MRRVLHLKMITQCAMLEDFGIFLVLADKVKRKSLSILPTPDFFSINIYFSQSLFAYDIEALRPPSPNSANTYQTPQKLNGSKDVHFFSVGSLGGRTLVIYMNKKGVSSFSITLSCKPISRGGQSDSIFRVLEPVVGKINERAKAPIALSFQLGLRQPRSEWFRVYRVRIHYLNPEDNPGS
jgi:RHO1 GDP-GTP exchange protein 1/2